jgi:hypothetical protein
MQIYKKGSSMTVRLEEITTHDDSEDCVACRAQEFVLQVLLPAVGAWERTASLPRLSIALHGAAGLLGSMLAEGIPRDDIESSLSGLLDEIEGQLTEDQAIGAPQGTA